MSRVPSFLSKKSWAVVGVLVAFWALSVAARVLWNGDVYGLNYGTLHGDGACYSFAAYSYAGISERGITEINSAYEQAGVPIVDLAVPGICDNIKLGARVLYPMISAPFVIIVGLSGMLVAPAIAWLLAVLVPAIMLLRRGLFLGPLVAGSLALASTSIARWSVANITDAVVMGLSAGMLALLPLASTRSRWWRVTGIVVLVVLASLTRQSWPIWIAMVTIPWLGLAFLRSNGGWKSAVRLSNTWFVLVLTVIPVAIGSHLVVSALLGSQNAAHLASVVQRQVVSVVPDIQPAPERALGPEPSSATGGHGEATTSGSGVEPLGTEQMASLESTLTSWLALTRYLSERAFEVVITDTGQLVVLDRGLLVLIGLAVLGSYMNRRWVGSYAFIGVFGTTILLSLLNTTLGVNFRFQLPAVPFIVLLAGVSIQTARARMTQVWSSGSHEDDRLNESSGKTGID